MLPLRGTKDDLTAGSQQMAKKGKVSTSTIRAIKPHRRSKPKLTKTQKYKTKTIVRVRQITSQVQSHQQAHTHTTNHEHKRQLLGCECEDKIG